MKLAYIQYHVKQLTLLGLYQFLCRKGLASLTNMNIDLQKVLKLIKKKNLANPSGFFYRPLAPIEVEKAISVRNDTDHLNLNNIDLTWQSNLPAYILLCQSVNQSGVAADIQRIINRMMTGFLDGIVQFSFSFGPHFSHEKAFGLSQIVYGVLLRYLAKAIWQFLRLKLGITSLTIDLYANLKFIKDKVKTNPDFLAPGGSSRSDANLLNIVYDTRMDNAHGGFIRGSSDYRPQLESVVEILDLINKHDDALEVQEIIDRLVRLETDGALVTNDNFKFMEP